MPGEQIVNIGHASISFNRADAGIAQQCIFCERFTSRGLAHRLLSDVAGEWRFLSMCDNCHDAIKKIPTNNSLKVEDRQGNIIV